ncbi:MAG: hypothetical protein Q8861_10610 [Bacteroidota bacterium]|nr:hypothetical protein [Bacteroidota bacterium]
MCTGRLFILIFIAIGSITSCKNPAKKANTIWQTDKLGCKGIRSDSLAYKLIKDYDLKGKSIKDFKVVFGEPNKVIQSQNRIILEYYYNAICDSNVTLIERGDKCYADFYFDIFDHFKFVDFVCE